MGCLFLTLKQHSRMLSEETKEVPAAAAEATPAQEEQQNGAASAKDFSKRIPRPDRDALDAEVAALDAQIEQINAKIVRAGAGRAGLRRA